MRAFSTLSKLLLTAAVASALLPASASAADRAALERDARAALQKLTNTVPAAKSMSSSATAVLVFPKVTKAGLGVGGQYGDGPSVVILDEGKARTLSTTTAKDDIYAFIFGQKGLMAGLGLQGNKITRLKV